MVKVTLLLADMADFAQVNEIMASFFTPPYPARATYQVAALPKGARVEVEGVLVLKRHLTGSDDSSRMAKAKNEG